MKRLKQYIILLFLVIQSCISPNEIEIIEDFSWAVYGIVGEDKPPVIFVYSAPEGSFTYSSSARIALENSTTGVVTLLVPEIAGEELEITSEFPFYEDWSGKRIYYTTPQAAPLPGGNYKVVIDLDGLECTGELFIPEKVGFSDLYTSSSTDSEGNEIDRLFMSIDDIPGDDIYKWEITVDEIIDVNVPVEYDDVTGEPVSFITEQFVIQQEITPSKYITQKTILDKDNLFKFNLSSTFPDFPYTDEHYTLKIRLRHYHRDLLDYFESVAGQQNGALFDPFIEPVFIQSNISGVPGVIGTYAYSDEIILEYRPD